MGWPAVLEHGGGEGVQCHSVGEVQEQAKHQGHYHAPSNGSPQNSHHKDREVDHTEPEFSEEALAASLVRGSMLLLSKPLLVRTITALLLSLTSSVLETSAEVGDRLASGRRSLLGHLLLR